jgi:hypothetical protein
MTTKPQSEADEAEEAALFPAYRAVQAMLGTRFHVEKVGFPLPDIFSIAFVRLFLGDCPNYQQPDGSYGASRSNWTYHTALAMAQAAKLLKWTCKFETLGKRDAILETQEDDPPVTVLVAEWEWDSNDIFGPGKELDKLQHTCREHKGAAAFLLTYCAEAQYPDFLQRVADQWCPASGRRRATAGLYLHTIIYTEQGTFRKFERLRTATIQPGRLELWCDEVFD